MVLLIHEMKQNRFITIGGKKNMLLGGKILACQDRHLFPFEWKHGILYILVTLSRLDESSHKIAIKHMKKLVYIEYIYIVAN
jgi:hypothetical protein